MTVHQKFLMAMNPKTLKRYRGRACKSGADFSYWHTLEAESFEDATKKFEAYLDSVGGGFMADIDFLEFVCPELNG